MTSPYASTGPKLIDCGYHAIPIMPGSKRPGNFSFGQWYGTSSWQDYCDRIPTEYEFPLWAKWPNAGVCVALDHRLKVIDIDTDNPALMAAVLSVLPDSPVKKRGQKGFSAFYQGSPAIVSAPFTVKRERVVDLLAHGRQTVLPPTIHPSSGKPYTWTDQATLIDTPIDELPALPDNVATLIAEALTSFGYVPEPERHIVNGEMLDGDSMWREINNLAVANYSAWVPELRLPGMKPQPGGYRAVASWRGVEDSNLSFHADGIMDWGEQKPYTPISLVMVATSCDLYTATNFLCERLGYKPTIEDNFDMAGFVARSLAKREKPTVTLVAPELSSEPDVPAIEQPEPIAIAAPRATVDPFDFDTCSGLLHDIAQWIFTTSRSPVPEFSTIASLAFLSAFYGRRYVGPTGLGLNLYLIGIAGPGFGKDHPRRAIETLAYDAQFQWLIGPNEVTSDSAIEKVLRRRPCFVLPWDEVGVMFQGLAGRQSQSWTRSIRKAMLELYSKSTGLWTGKEHADPTQDKSAEPIHCPTVSILGMSTPTEFYSGITEQNLSDGMVARMTIISATKRPKRHNAPPVLAVPEKLKTDMKAAYAAFPIKKNLAEQRSSTLKPVLYAVPWEDDAAEQRWVGIENWQLDQIDENPEQEGIVGRAAEQTLKLATIRALSRDAASPVVGLADIEWGWAVVQSSLDTIDVGVKVHLAGSEFERLCKDIEGMVILAGGEGIAKSALLRRKGVSKAEPRMFDAAIKWLAEAGKVRGSLTGITKSGAAGHRYFAIDDPPKAIASPEGV